MQAILLVVALGLGALGGAALAMRHTPSRRRHTGTVLEGPSDPAPAGLKHLASGMSGTAAPGFQLTAGARLPGRPRLASVLEAR